MPGEEGRLLNRQDVVEQHPEERNGPSLTE